MKEITIYSFTLLLTIVHHRNINTEKIDCRESLTTLWNRKALIGISFVYFTFLYL